MRRPGKKDLAPAPLYLTEVGDVPYCFTCGRVISSKKARGNDGTPTKYCSDRCRRRKPGEIDQQIERMIYSLLQGQANTPHDKSNVQAKSRKGDPRIVVSCDEIEALFFRRRSIDHSHALDLKRDNNRNSDHETKERATFQYSDSDIELDGVDKDNLADQLNKAQTGQKHAEEREFIRRIARRAVVFGLPVEKFEDSKLQSRSNEPALSAMRKCEAVQDGRVVEPSFAKGNWAIRWRD